MTGATTLPLVAGEQSFMAAGECLVRRSVLPSGLRILSERVPGARSATIGFWVTAGSRDEAPDEYGSTHFLEHLLFKGTHKRTALDIAVSFDAVGGEHNAITAKEYTCYYGRVRDSDVPMAIEVLADMITSSVIDPDEFETEREVILEEIAMAEDDLGDVASERFFEALFGDHSLGRPIGGSPETIREATREGVWHHYRRNYSPNRLVVTVAGAVDHDDLVEAVQRHLTLGGWDLETPAEPAPRRDAEQAVPTTASSKLIVPRPSEQANILMGVRGLAATDARRSTLSVLNSVLGGGMSSRLFQQIRERRGLAYSVYSFSPSYSDAGVLGMYAGCSPAKAESVAALMLEEFRSIGTGGILQAELERAVGQMGGASALALEDSDTRMSRLGRAEITMGEFVDLDEALRRLSLVTIDDVADLGAELASRPVSLAAVGSVADGMFITAEGA